MIHAYLALVGAQRDAFAAPALQLQRLAVDHFERLAMVQIEALQGYTRVALEHMRAVTAAMHANGLARATDPRCWAMCERFDRDRQTPARQWQGFDDPAVRLSGNVIFLDRRPRR